MYNLLIAIAIAVAAYAVGAIVPQSWLAGFIPGVLGLGIAYVLLARRSGKQLQGVMERVQEMLKIDPSAPVAFKKQRLADAVAALESARPLGKWQFLVEGQIDAQLGQLAYLQMDFKTARVHLEKAWSRNWMAMSLLSAIDFREKKKEEALKRLEKTTGAGAKEAIFWAFYTWVLVETNETEKALGVLARGLKALPDNEPLKEMRNCISNKKKLRMKDFGEMWYMIFPEKMIEDGMIPMQQPANRGPGYPMPRGARVGHVRQRKG